MLIHWLLAGGSRRGHVVLLACAVGVVAAYVAGMLAVFGDEYWSSSSVQFGRASGTWNSGGGSVSSTGDIATVFEQYRLFYATIAIAVVGLLMLVVRVGWMIAKCTRAPAREIGVTFSWLIAGLLFFAVLQIRFPQYFMMVLIPLYGYVAIETVRWWSRHGPGDEARGSWLVVTLLVLDGVTFVQRIASRSDNALEAVAAFANARIPASRRRDDGAADRRPDPAALLRDVERRSDACVARKWLIDYRTDLFEPEHAYGIELPRADARRVATFVGFKERIVGVRAEGLDPTAAAPTHSPRHRRGGRRRRRRSPSTGGRRRGSSAPDR